MRIKNIVNKFAINRINNDIDKRVRKLTLNSILHKAKAKANGFNGQCL